MGISKYILNKADLFNSTKIPSAGLALLDKISSPVWNRLESRPRGNDFERSLRAEVRDSLWMLSRQWQMGEFQGEDAGTPVYCNLKYNCSPVEQMDNIPLEPKIESQPIFHKDMPKHTNLNLRVKMGNYWLKLLSGVLELNVLKLDFIQNPKYSAILDITDVSIEVLQFMELYKGRSFDGYEFFINEDRFSTFDTSQKTKLNALFVKFKRWFESTFLQQSDNHWNNSRLEYVYDTNTKLKSSNPANQTVKELSVNEYYHGHLDWYNFEITKSIDKSTDTAFDKKIKILEYSKDNPGKRKLMPSPVFYNGIPESRYWAFEDGGTNFAGIKAGNIDLAKLALIEFGLIYSNDWSITPIKIPVGSFTTVESLTVIDSFGKSTQIQAVNNNAASTWDTWSYFTLDKIKTNKNEKSDNMFFYPQTITKALESKLLEEVYLIRDEMANMVWAIETIVQSPLGTGISGRENASTGIKTKKGDLLRYEESTTPPQNWIPFIPLIDNSKLILRRGVVVDENNEKIRPLTSLMRNGISIDDDSAIKFDIEENEITRDGIKVTKSFQRTRWTNGEVYLWLGLQKYTGRGGGSSGLAFDLINPYSKE